MNKKSHNDEITFEEKFNDYGEYENNTDDDYTISSIDSAPSYESDNYEKDNDDDSTKAFIKKLTIVTLGIVIIILIILLLIKACAGTGTGGKKQDSLEAKLLKAGKDYFETVEMDKPTVKGTCNTVKLGTLKDLEYLSDDFIECDNENTYVKVCMLESGALHYLPVMECNGTENDTVFGDFKEGTEADLVADKSDVKFEYKASYLDTVSGNLGKVEEIWKDDIKYDNYKTLSVTNYYSYRDKEYTWTLRKRLYYPGDVLNASDEDTYYLKYPANNYINKTAKATVYRWYELKNKVYYPVNDGYAGEAPSGYPYHDEKENVAYVFYYQRTWVEKAKPSYLSPTKMYVCVNPDVKNTKYYSYEECSLNANPKYNEGYTKTEKIIYTCDNGMTTVSSTAKCTACPANSTLRGDKSSCGNFTAWGSAQISDDFKTPICDVKKDTCTSQTVVVKRWYKADKNYIGTASPTGQAPYYATAPKAGAYKEADSKATGYKWYKLVDTRTTTEYYATAPQQDAVKTNQSRWGSWTSYSAKKPEAKKGSREIRTKQKVKLQQILEGNNASWKDVTEDYLTEEELIKALQKLGYKVNTLEEISLNGDIKLTTKLYLRDRI